MAYGNNNGLYGGQGGGSRFEKFLALMSNSLRDRARQNQLASYNSYSGYPQGGNYYNPPNYNQGNGQVYGSGPVFGGGGTGYPAPPAPTPQPSYGGGPPTFGGGGNSGQYPSPPTPPSQTPPTDPRAARDQYLAQQMGGGGFGLGSAPGYLPPGFGYDPGRVASSEGSDAPMYDALGNIIPLTTADSTTGEQVPNPQIPVVGQNPGSGYDTYTVTDPNTGSPVTYYYNWITNSWVRMT